MILEHLKRARVDDVGRGPFALNVASLMLLRLTGTAADEFCNYIPYCLAYGQLLREWFHYPVLYPMGYCGPTIGYSILSATAAPLSGYPPTELLRPHYRLAHGVEGNQLIGRLQIVLSVRGCAATSLREDVGPANLMKFLLNTNNILGNSALGAEREPIGRHFENEHVGCERSHGASQGCSRLQEQPAGVPTRRSGRRVPDESMVEKGDTRRQEKFLLRVAYEKASHSKKTPQRRKDKYIWAILTRLPHMQIGFDSRWEPLPGFHMWESCGSAGFLGDLPLPPPLHSSAAPYSPRSVLIGSQDLDVKGFACREFGRQPGGNLKISPNLLTQSHALSRWLGTRTQQREELSRKRRTLAIARRPDIPISSVFSLQWPDDKRPRPWATLLYIGCVSPVYWPVEGLSVVYEFITNLSSHGRGVLGKYVKQRTISRWTRKQLLEHMLISKYCTIFKLKKCGDQILEIHEAGQLRYEIYHKRNFKTPSHHVAESRLLERLGGGGSYRRTSPPSLVSANERPAIQLEATPTASTRLSGVNRCQTDLLISVVSRFHVSSVVAYTIDLMWSQPAVCWCEVRNWIYTTPLRPCGTERRYRATPSTYSCIPAPAHCDCYLQVNYGHQDNFFLGELSPFVLVHLQSKHLRKVKWYSVTQNAAMAVYDAPRDYKYRQAICAYREQ
ncbi:hypothetical protein PR048_033178 [Dryococelus australis]|uniref:Uncharacterized protein n=1 Tax=Dryococelus australis TaxID=614101 RepID=A0ABQ9FZJ0_9NEOP|nr:hypothetical protein PR048_033178 [Dryococelus australis]